MPSRNEIVPLDMINAPGPKGVPVESPTGVTATTLTNPNANNNSPKKLHPKFLKNQQLNAEATSSQERRLRLVSNQRRHTTFQVFYASFGVILMVIQMEYLWFNNTKSLPMPCPVDPAPNTCARCLDAIMTPIPATDGRMILHALRVLISLSTAIMLYYIYLFYAAECEVMKIKNIFPPKATLFSSSLRKNLLVECLVFVVHPFPGLEDIDPRWPNLVVATSLLMLTRLFLVLRVIQFRHSFNTSNGWFIGSLTNVDFSAAFFLKSTLKNHPGRCIVTCFVLLLCLVGYSLYVVERFLCAFVQDACCQPMRFADALWSLVITILTIGYGDVVPRTGPGRFFAVIAGLCGTLFIAVTIAVMSNYLVLTRSEHKVNAFLKKDENRRLINDHAARAIQSFMQLRVLQRRQSTSNASKSSKSLIQRAETKLFDVLRVYRKIKRHVNSNDASDPMDKQMTMLEMMEVNVEYIRTKIEDLTELFHHQLEKNKNRRLSRLVGDKAMLVAMASTATCPIPSTTTTTDASAIPPTSSPKDDAIVSASSSSSPSPHRAPSRMEDHLDASDRKRSPSLSLTETCTEPVVSAAAPASTTTTTTPSSEMPEWAVALETTLKTILTQVSNVSMEVDSMRTRVQQQMDDVNLRLNNLERRIGIQDAFREIVHSKSSRQLLQTDSNASTHSNGAATALATVAAPSLGLASVVLDDDLSIDSHHRSHSPHHHAHLAYPSPSSSPSPTGRSNTPPAQSSSSSSSPHRFPRLSFANKKPSITNFFTAQDLDDFKT